MLTLLLACASPPPGPDVVLVSLDTTRADAIDPETTPNLWAIAERGVRFTAAFAHAPTTLSSHASVFTGLDPHGHAVARNGYALAADLPVLPERLAAAGFDTLAAIGASALARPMGVDRGFRLWDETLGHAHQGKRYEAHAAEVTDRALALLDERARGKRAFLFVHYYDAHAPYVAPAPWGTKWVDPAYTGTFDGTPRAMNALADGHRAGHVDPADVAALRARYRGEVSYVDAELGRLLATLKDPYVVVFGDHGEALGDVADRPWGHGPDVDPPAIHVPLIVAGPGVPAKVVDTPVALSDVGPTVLALAGAAGALGDGRDLAALWTGAPFAERPIFLEATQPRPVEEHTRWNNLRMERGVLRGDWLLLTAPWLGEAPTVARWDAPAPSVTAPPAPGWRNDPNAPAGLADTLGTALSAWDAAAPGPRGDEADERTKEGLRALGYAD